MPDTAPDLPALSGKTIVVKYGGAAMSERTAVDAWASDVVSLAAAGARVVVVHGGGPDLTSALDAFGVQTEFHNGHRVTDAMTARVAEMVLSGSVNKSVVSLIQRSGGRAVGLSGTDGGLLEIEPHRPGGTDIGFVGRVVGVDVLLPETLLGGGFIPVISSTAADGAGRVHNINADMVAGAVAAALPADIAVFLSDVPGVMDDGNLRSQLTTAEAEALLDDGTASGGMRPKLEAALEALHAGVGCVRLVDGREPGALVGALADSGRGTTLRGTETP